MSDFAAIWQDTMPSLDSMFGRMVIITKRRQGPYVWEPDPDLPAFIVVGVLDQRPIALRQLGGNAERADQPDRVSSECTIDFDARVFPTSAHVPDEGWNIVTVPSAQHPVAQAFEVTWREPSGEGRINLHIVPVTL